MNTRKLCAFTSLIATFVTLAPQPVFAAPELPPPWQQKKLTLELKNVDAATLYRIVADTAGAPIRIDACVTQKHVDLKLQNAPFPVVLDVLAAKLGVVHSVEGGVVVGRCVGQPALAVVEFKPTPSAEVTDDEVQLKKRITMVLRGVTARAAFQKIAEMTDSELFIMGDPPMSQKLSVELHNVTAETALLVLTETLGLENLPGRVEGELLVDPTVGPRAY